MFATNGTASRRTCSFIILTFVTIAPLVPVHSAAQSLDQYGGYQDLPAPGGATGHFRVEKIGTRWVFVTPTGNVFWMRAVYVVDGVSPGATYQNAVTAKYGGYTYTFTSQAVKRLKAWGFNALGEYASTYAWPVGAFGKSQSNPEKAPFIYILNAGYYGMRNGPVKNLYAGIDTTAFPRVYVGRFPDVFDPAFAASVAWFLSSANTILGGPEAMNANPWILGITPDDSDYTTGFGPGPAGAVIQGKTHPHLGWVAAVTNPAQSTGNFQGTPKTYADPTVYTKYALRDFLQAQYGTLAALNAAWGSSYTSWDSNGGWPYGTGFLDESGRHPWIGGDFTALSTASAQAKLDLDAFLFNIAAKYFSTYATSMQAATPNLLLFSPATMMGGAREQVVRAAGQYVDAIQTSGIPGGPSYELYKTMYAQAGKPLFVWTTFTAQADAALINPNLAGWGPAYNQLTQEARGQAYAAEIANLVGLQATNGEYFITGIDWWMWVDKVVGGENMNFGLVTSRDNAYNGKEAVVAPGADPWGYLTGGEVANYGDFLSTVIQAHTNILPVLLGSQPVSGTITAPPNGSVVTGTVSVTATASDNVGVTRVDLLLDGTLAATFSGATAGYSWNTTTTSNGSHTWVAKAYDAAGNTGLSAPVGVTVSNADTTPPTVSITSPVNGALVKSNSTITIAATASDNVGVTTVEFYVNGSRKCSVANSPYTCAWKVRRASGRTYQLQAKAYDAAGNVGPSSTVTVTPF